MITCYAFRNTDVLEDVHDGVLKLDDWQLRELMMISFTKVETWLRLKAKLQEWPTVYNIYVNLYWRTYCNHWED